jgi:hypothetical protein
MFSAYECSMRGPAYQGGQRLAFPAPVLKCSPSSMRRRPAAEAPPITSRSKRRSPSSITSSTLPILFPDTISKVIHCRGRRAAAKPSSAAAPAVNNFAESTAELVKSLPLANDGRVRKAALVGVEKLPFI